MIWTAIKSFFACAWSAFSYIPPWGKMPADKQSYWKNCFGFGDDELKSAWAEYWNCSDYHHLKNIGVEWTRLAPQRAFKLTALFGCLLAILAMIIGGTAACGLWMILELRS